MDETDASTTGDDGDTTVESTWLLPIEKQKQHLQLLRCILVFGDCGEVRGPLYYHNACDLEVPLVRNWVSNINSYFF